MLVFLSLCCFNAEATCVISSMTHASLQCKQYLEALRAAVLMPLCVIIEGKI